MKIFGYKNSKIHNTLYITVNLVPITFIKYVFLRVKMFSVPDFGSGIEISFEYT